MDELARIVFADEPLEQILLQITEIAERVVPGVAAVSITLIADGVPTTAASSAAIALELDERQYAAGHGPCLDAARYGQEKPIADMATEPRWPDYALLNLYALEPHAFDAERLARTFAGFAAITLYNAQIYADSSALALQIQEALVSRAAIEQAKGIVMGSRRCSAEDAFGILRTLSQTSNTKLRVVAQALFGTAVDPSLPSF